MGEQQMRIDILPVGFLKTNCYIVSDSLSGAAVIDPGDEPKKILAFLRENRLNCLAVLITHGHFDHVGGVSELVRASGAELVMNPLDAGSVRRKIDRQAEDLCVIEAGELRFTTLATPGHSPGSVCYLIEEALFSGDTLFYESVGRTDLPGGDGEALKSSLDKLFTLDRADLRVLPGHMRETTLKHERKYNPFIK